MIHIAIDRIRYASPAFWRGVVVFGVALVSVLYVMSGLAHATWKPEYGKSPEAVQQWFRSAEIMPAARARLGVYTCCEQAEQLHTKFVGNGTEWSYYPDPDCTHKGCTLLPIPNDVVHDEPIKAIDPKDNDLPEFQAMRAEGLLFIWNGKPTCFWPPDGGI